jgi:hypothetical protein
VRPCVIRVLVGDNSSLSFSWRNSPIQALICSASCRGPAKLSSRRVAGGNLFSELRDDLVFLMAYRSSSLVGRVLGAVTVRPEASAKDGMPS